MQDQSSFTADEQWWIKKLYVPFLLQTIFMRIIKRMWIAEQQGRSAKSSFSSTCAAVLFYTTQKTPAVAIVISFWQSTQDYLLNDWEKQMVSILLVEQLQSDQTHNIIKTPALHFKLAWNSSQIIKLRWRLGLLEIGDLWTNNHSRLLMRHKQSSKVWSIF